MKQTAITAFAILFLCAGITGHAQQTTKGTKGKEDKTKMKADMAVQQVDLPYTVSSSSQFTMGKPAQAKMVLDLYQAYDASDFSKADWFADTLTAIFPDGQLVRGRDAVLDMFKQARASLSSNKFEITAVMPTHSIDRNEDWVSVWGRQRSTTASDNMQTSMEFNNIWRLNKDGKVDFIELFQGKTPTQQQ